MLHFEKIDGKTYQKNYKNAKRRMLISDLIAATTLAFMLNILQKTPEQCVAFVNTLDAKQLVSALEEHGGNSLFIFSLGIIYIKAKATRSFPMRLAELLSHHVHHASQGSQEFLQVLNEAFDKNKDNFPRFLWGMCSNVSPKEIESFLKMRNSTPLMIFHWLQMAIREQKQIVKEFFQILERIKKDPTHFEDVIRTLIANKTQLIFNFKIGCIAVAIDTGVVFNLLLLFEINWDFTFAELSLIRNFLRKRPINASFLTGPSGYMSEKCSRYLIGDIMNLPGLIDASGRLTEGVLLLPANVARIAEYVYFIDNQLGSIFQNSHHLFNTILIPEKYSIADVFIFFHNIHIMGNSELFSRMIYALKEYGNKLNTGDLKSLPQVLRKISDDRRDAAYFWLAFMCIDRQEPIGCLNDHIILLRAILNRDSSQIQVEPFFPTNFPNIVRKLRECLPDFVLNMMAHCVTWKTGQTQHCAQLLPVIQTELASDSVMIFIKDNSHELPYMLQLLMLSKTIAEIWVNMAPVMEYVGIQAQQLPSNDISFMVMREEIFQILQEIFKRFAIEITDFTEKISALLPNHPTNSIQYAFIHDQRFENLTRGIHDDLKVSEMEIQCQTHLATMPPGSTLTDAQRELNVVLFDCSICISRNTPNFSFMFPCGHTSCCGCFEQLKRQQKKIVCPICRADITFCVKMDNLGLRFKKPARQPAGQPACGGDCASIPLPAKKSKCE